MVQMNKLVLDLRETKLPYKSKRFFCFINESYLAKPILPIGLT